MSDNQNSPRPIQIHERDFPEQVLKSEVPVLVEFWAPWSQPCKILDSVLSDVAASWSGTVKVVKVNADDSLELSLWYDIQSVPTLIYFLAGKPRVRIVGTASKEAILAKVSSANLETGTEEGGQHRAATPNPEKN